MDERKAWEGLNLPQLMERMHAPVEPAPISFWPATDGWWIVAAWVAGVSLVLGWRARRRRVANRYRREALARLDELATPTARELGELLRRTALAAFPRETVASLYGETWAAFLVETSGGDPVVAAAAPELARAPYRDDPDVSRLVAPARRWIEVHRA